MRTSPDAEGDADIWKLIEEWMAIGVAVLPGTAFGSDFGGWVRLSLATRREDVAAAARTLCERYAVVGATRAPGS